MIVSLGIISFWGHAGKHTESDRSLEIITWVACAWKKRKESQEWSH